MLVVSMHGNSVETVWMGHCLVFVAGVRFNESCDWGGHNQTRWRPPKWRWLRRSQSNTVKTTQMTLTEAVTIKHSEDHPNDVDWGGHNQTQWRPPKWRWLRRPQSNKGEDHPNDVAKFFIRLPTRSTSIELTPWIVERFSQIQFQNEHWQSQYTRSRSSLQVLQAMTNHIP